MRIAPGTFALFALSGVCGGDGDFQRNWDGKGQSVRSYLGDLIYYIYIILSYQYNWDIICQYEKLMWFDHIWSIQDMYDHIETYIIYETLWNTFVWAALMDRSSTCHQANSKWIPQGELASSLGPDPPMSKLCYGVFGRDDLRCDPVQIQHQVPDKVPEGSGAETLWGSGGLVRFRRVPIFFLHKHLMFMA